MRRTSLAALLAAPALLSCPGLASANPPKQCYSPFGFGGLCLGIFSKLHQHGPLYNYGPYYGYPPFEPYGPWNSYLQYNPWYYGQPGVGGHGHGHGHGDKSGRGGLFAGGCGWHASWGHGGWFRGSNCGGSSCGSRLFKGHGAPCHSCGAPAITTGGCAGCKAAHFDPRTTDPVSRYAGSGSPANSSVYYAGLPTIDPAITPVGGIAK